MPEIPLCESSPVVRHVDSRGALVKLWPGPVSGEVYAVELHPGHSRGHHLHRRGGESFMALVGAAVLVVEDPATGRRERHELCPGGARVRVEPGLAHALWAAGNGVSWVIAVADLEHADEQTVPHRVAPW